MHHILDGRKLPRLLYVGDVPVEASYHGSALLYRLLQDYPPAQLRILETNLASSLQERRLGSVNYRVLPLGFPRLLRTRFARGYSSWLSLGQRSSAARIASQLDDFEPEALLTVAHGFAWDAAARFAAERTLPLHLICHDDWPRVANVYPFLGARVERRFGEVYRQSASRLCVSPFMRDTYRERYSAPGEVLYPSRAADCPEHAEPPERLREDHPLTVAFGGTVNTPGYVLALRLMARALSRIGGRLLIFGPLTAEHARRDGLDLPNIELRGLVSSGELMARFRTEVDALFVPMSFEADDRANMQIAFPSKLTDYTAVGLPLLIYGPEYCSAVRWARENPGVAEVVTQPEEAALTAVLNRLAQSPEVRRRLGESALRIGARSFAHRVARDQLYAALGGAT